VPPFTVSLVLPGSSLYVIFLNEISCLSTGVFVCSRYFSDLFPFIFCYRSVGILEEFIDIIVSDRFLIIISYIMVVVGVYL
jgi:hypothetical protein